jgi:hypothetical protein
MHGVNKDRVKLWIQALRSGEYTQCQNVLEYVEEDDDGVFTGKKRHCCLGVAQRVALANGYIDQDESSLEWGSEGMDYDIARNWFGFTEEMGGGDPDLGHFTDTDGELISASCVQANDDLGWSFQAIADALEARYVSPENIEREA